ncbi:MAG: DUF58 domain-containing protein [Deltaproteobacteria bacterium]|nr:DUF58 domain-containing protein [Deltaproteobacteria bacterium]
MLTKDLIKKVRQIEIYTSRMANDQIAGQYQSVFKGRGMAFSEVRQYQMGDDVRFIDWNVSARMQEVYVKLFTEEREMTVMLVVDVSASEQFGSVGQPKNELVAEVAALIAFSAIKNNDRVGLIIVSDRVERFVPPKKGKKHVLRVISEILNFQPEHPGTDLEVGLEFLGKIARRRSIAFLISDFVASGYEHALRVANQRHDVVPVVIVDPRELELPAAGVVWFEDLETGAVLPVDTGSSKVREAYRLHVARQRAARETMFRRMRMDSVTVRTDQPYVKALVDFFAERARRLRFA